ncbi:MAG: FGGY-family carbohydrate kinase [Thermodesulfobacteriota bacterium]|nr:FGGY-family carbohydrate kinase [Thermodesulfobacteriota bacterium]
MTNAPYILAIDHGTSGIKTALVSVYGRVMDFAFQPTDTLFLKDGGVEQAPDEWWRAVISTTARLMNRQCLSGGDIAAVSVSSTFSSTVAVDAQGCPLMNAVTWMDTRGGPYVRSAMAGFPSFEGYGIGKAMKWVRRTGGAPTLSGKDDIGHVLFIKNRHPGIYDKTRWFLPSKDYLNLRLTGIPAATVDSIHLFWVTDIRNINHVGYDDGLIRGFGIDRQKLPPLMVPTDILGTVSADAATETGLAAGTPVVAGSPDHQTACVGSGAVRDFHGHIYVGTSCWVQCPVPFKKTDVLHSVASFPTAIPGRYQAVNEQDIAGKALDFAHELLYGAGQADAGTGSTDPYAMMTALAESAPAGSGGVMFTPWLNGERTPVDDETIRGCLFNLSMTTTRHQIMRAVLEGVACNTRWSLKYVERFIKKPLTRTAPVTIIGGGARSDTWCRIFADVLNRDIRRPEDPVQANARGAAFIASAAMGYITFDDIPELMTYDAFFSPRSENRAVYDDLFDNFRRLYTAHKGICKTLNRTGTVS